MKAEMSRCYDTHEENASGRNVQTRGSRMLVYCKFSLMIKIERPSGHNLISLDEPKRGGED